MRTPAYLTASYLCYEPYTICPIPGFFFRLHMMVPFHSFIHSTHLLTACDMPIEENGKSLITTGLSTERQTLIPNSLREAFY